MNIINRINVNMKNNKILYLMVLIFFCLGIAIGTYTVKYMNHNNTTDLSNYFSSFVTNIIADPINKQGLFFDILKKNIILLTIITLCAFTFFGSPIILLIDLIKGFTLGYTFSFLLTTMNGNGIWLALGATVPQNIIYLPCFISLSILGIEFSSIKLRDKFFNKGKVNTIIEKEIIFKIGVYLCIFILGTIIEAYISPNLLQLIITKVYKIS